MSSCLIYESLVGDVPGGEVRVTRIVAVCPASRSHGVKTLVFLNLDLQILCVVNK